MNNQTSPWIFSLLRRFCPEQLREEIEGDIMERFHRDVLRVGERKAKRKLIFNTIRFFRAGILLRNRFSFPSTRIHMISNYTIVALRNFERQKWFTALNVIGLSVGIAATILILQYVKYERSFDSFHSRAKDIYRLQYNIRHNGKLNVESAAAVPAVGPALKSNFEDVEEFTRLYPVGGVMTYESRDRGLISFHEEKMPYADPSIFNVFDFKVINGDKRTCLEGPNKVMLSERAAKKYFNDNDPIGEVLTLNNTEPFEVTGVFEDVPENSHVKFDFLLSYETLGKTYDSYQTSWGWYDFYTYVLVKPSTNIESLQQRWDEFLKKEKGDKWKTSSQEFILRPLLDIHLKSHLLYEIHPDQQGDSDSIYALSIIALFVIAIAMINYVNLATARSFSRANEVGVRKVIGALRKQLVTQFLVESTILHVIALVIALLSVRLLWVPFSSLAGWNIPMAFLYQRDFWLLVSVILVGGVILSGLYPALMLSSFKPVAVLKGKVFHNGQGQWMRKALVTFQFVASISLIVGATIVYRQLSFMKSSDLGISIDKTLVLRGTGSIDSTYNQRLESFKHEVEQIPAVKTITATTNIPGDEIFWTGGIKRFSGGPEDHIMMSHAAIDYNFLSSFGLKLIAGRNFNREFPNDDKRVLVNKKLTEVLEFKDPQSAIGERLWQQGDTIEIVGVVEDYHQMSLKNEVVPMVLMLRQSAVYYALKIQSGNYKEVLASIEKPWKTFFADAPIDYFLLDEFYNRQYVKDDRFGKVVSLFTALAIFIATLGLLGLASYVTVQRTKEIGIRKVLGSSVSGIVLLLSGGFMRYVILANVIAWPLTWWIMEEWLQSFPYRISISPLIFLFSGVAVALMAFISVSSQTIRAALRQPVKTLRYE